MPDKRMGQKLAKLWGLSVEQPLYRKTGNWYHLLKKFPGALLDADGYVIFKSEEEFRTCPQLQVRKEVGAPKGIKAIPGYVRMPSTDGQNDCDLVEAIIRGQDPADGQRWAASAEARKAIESYAMDLALCHYRRLWREVSDVSAFKPFDILCRDSERELRVEVKGTTSSGISVLLTRNEVLHAQANSGRVALFVASNIVASASAEISGGSIHIFEPWNIQDDGLDPIAYQCWLKGRRTTTRQIGT
jgi:hypothetical protein